jgi:hypothetical protein
MVGQTWAVNNKKKSTNSAEMNQKQTAEVVYKKEELLLVTMRCRSFEGGGF